MLDSISGMVERRAALISCAVLSGLAALAGIIVMGAVSDEVQASYSTTIHGDIQPPSPTEKSPMYVMNYCKFNPTIKGASCGFGIALGALGFIFGLVFLALAVIDLVRPSWLRGGRASSSGKTSRSDDAPSSKAVDICRTAMAATWAFLFLICFGIMATEWNGNPLKQSTEVKNAAQGAIAFSFFAFLFWVALSVLYGLRVRGQFRSPTSGPSSDCGEANIQVSDGEIEMEADLDDGDEAAIVYCEQ